MRYFNLGSATLSVITMKKLIIVLLYALTLSYNVSAQITIVPFNAQWKYLDNGSNQGTSWRGISFNDLTWKTGNGKFGYGIADATTLINFGPDSKVKYITTYFRKSISIANPSAYPFYTAQIKRDDGVVVYVNNVEVYRNNMRAGSFTYDSLAVDGASDDGTAILNFNINSSAFVAGNNVIAVEVHQQKVTTSDMAFDLSLSTPDLTLPSIISINRQIPLSGNTFLPEVTFRITLSEPVTGLGRSDFILIKTGTANGTIGTLQNVGTNSTVFDLNITTVTGTGILRLDLRTSGTGITDLQGNVIANGGFTQGQTFTIDPVAPQVISINRQQPPDTATTTSSSLIYRLTFSEPVTGVTVSDFTLTTVSGSASGTIATVTPFQSQANIYDITLSSLSGQGILRLDLKNTGTGITDSAGNALPAGFTTGQTYSIKPADQISPTIISILRASPLTETTTLNDITYRVSFSETVSGVDPTDFSLIVVNGMVNGTAAIKTISATGTGGSSFDIRIQYLSGSGTIRLDLNTTNTGITDAAGNPINNGFTTGEIYVLQDNAPPTVLSINRNQPLSTTFSTDSVIYRITFSEPVSGLDVNDFSILPVSGTVSGIIASGALSPVGINQKEYDVTVSLISGTGSLRMDLKSVATGISDLSGNTIAGGFSAGQTYTKVIDEAPQVISLQRLVPSNSTTAAASVIFRITFSESVSGIDISDFTIITGGTVTGNIPVNGIVTGANGVFYDITVNGLTGAGTLQLNLNSDNTDIRDGSGNEVLSGFSSGQYYTIDRVAPEVLSIIRETPATAITSLSTLTFRVTFSEQITGLIASHFSLSTTGSVNGTLSASSISADPQSSVFDVTVTAVSGAGTIRLDLLSGNGITDLSGNGLVFGFSSGEIFTIDPAPSAISINRQFPLTDTTSASSVVFRVTFSEAVAGVDVSDFVVALGGSATGTLLSNAVTTVGTLGNTFDVRVSNITGSGIVHLDLKSSGTGIIDDFGNVLNGGFSNGQSYLIGQGPIVVSINRQVPLSISTSAGLVTFRVTFSKKVTGVDAKDFLVTGVSGNARGSLVHLAMETVGVKGTGSVLPVGLTGTTYDVSVRALAGTGTLRLDLKSSGTGIKDIAGIAISSGFITGQTYSIQQVGGFNFFTEAAPLSISTNTGERPQSKVWTYAGKWWTVLPVSGGTKIFRLDGTTWTPVLTVHSSSDIKADCIVNGSVTHILLFRGSSDSYLASIEYVPTSNTYKFWTGRTAVINLGVLASGVEAGSITLDGAGRMWLAFDGTTDFKVRWSDSPYSSWSSPITIATGATTDDICAIVTLPGKVGVFWSNQTTKRFGFKTHTNGSLPTSWSADENPASQSAKNIGHGFSDDHVNIVSGSDGTLYCAIKTSYDIAGEPIVGLLVRRPSGSWDNLYPVSSNEGTKPQVVLNEAAGKVKVLYASQTGSSGGEDIMYRESSLTNISFSRPYTLLGGNLSQQFNYVTATHQVYSSDLVIIASEVTTSPDRARTIYTTEQSGTIPGITTREAFTETVANPKTDENIPQEFMAYPNPFNHTTTITFILPSADSYTMTLYDELGVQISLLKNGWTEKGQRNTVVIDGSNFKPGVYLVRLTTRRLQKTLKLLLQQ